MKLIAIENKVYQISNKLYDLLNKEEEPTKTDYYDKMYEGFEKQNEKLHVIEQTHKPLFILEERYSYG